MKEYGSKFRIIEGVRGKVMREQVCVQAPSYGSPWGQLAKMGALA